MEIIVTDKADAKNIKIYFKNLNAIRCIAAFLVIVHHIEQFKDMFHLPNHWSNPVIESIGKLGVILFFVLSGFLISYLLFKEKEVTNTISIKDFYIRRILRIWPLYFLIILVSLFIMPNIEFFTLEGFEKEVLWDNLFYKILLFIFFLPNLVLNLFGFIPYASQTWSIGAEEQFYLVWPGLNKKIINKWSLLFGVIFFYILVKFSIQFFPSQIKQVFKGFWLSTPIDCMAIGGIFALIIYDATPIVLLIRKILFSKIIQFIALALTLFLITINYHLPILDQYFHFEMYAVLFGILIANFAANQNRIFSMENKISNYLGKISYGMYMYHPIIIVFCIKIGIMFNIIDNFVLYPIVFLLVVLLSSLSYEFYEKRFINKKARYSKIISGDNVKNN
jgi:peptidoglycan/LPS O-acetylase OafA/YrhL